MLPLQFWKLKVNDSKIDKTPVPANSENDETRDDMKVSMSNPSSPSTSPLPTPVSPNANALSVLTDTDSRLKISISDFEISDHVLFLPLPGKSKKHVAFTTDKTRLELNTDGLTIEVRTVAQSLSLRRFERKSFLRTYFSEPHNVALVSARTPLLVSRNAILTRRRFAPMLVAGELFYWEDCYD